jgi:hypothetical protein
MFFLNHCPHFLPSCIFLQSWYITLFISFLPLVLSTSTLPPFYTVPLSTIFLRTIIIPLNFFSSLRVNTLGQWEYTFFMKRLVSPKSHEYSANATECVFFSHNNNTFLRYSYHFIPILFILLVFIKIYEWILGRGRLKLFLSINVVCYWLLY